MTLFTIIYTHTHSHTHTYTALKIDMGDDVATANNKMEFLLDKAEARLRDTALCGW
jgi:hypothetical protein